MNITAGRDWEQATRGTGDLAHMNLLTGHTRKDYYLQGLHQLIPALLALPPWTVLVKELDFMEFNTVAC